MANVYCITIVYINRAYNGYILAICDLLAYALIYGAHNRDFRYS